MTAEEMLAMRGVAKNAWGEEESRPCYKRGHSGQRATGIALGAVGVGLAILGIPWHWLPQKHSHPRRRQWLTATRR